MTSSHYGRQGVRIPDDMQAKIIELARGGMTRNGIQRETGVSAAAISGICQRAGVTFDRSRIKAASQARTADLRARREALLEREYRQWEKLYDRLEAPKFKTLIKGQSGSQRVDELDFVPPEDLRHIHLAINAIAGRTRDLEARNAGNASDNVRSVLADLGRALGL